MAPWAVDLDVVTAPREFLAYRGGDPILEAEAAVEMRELGAASRVLDTARGMLGRLAAGQLAGTFARVMGALEALSPPERAFAYMATQAARAGSPVAPRFRCC